MSAAIERVSARLEDRIEAPDAVADIAGVHYHLNDWSARGLSLMDYDVPSKRGDRLRAIVKHKHNGVEKRFETGLFVVRADLETTFLAAVFVDYDRDAAVAIDKIFYPDDD